MKRPVKINFNDIDVRNFGMKEGLPENNSRGDNCYSCDTCETDGGSGCDSDY